MPIQVKASSLPPPPSLDGAALFLDFDGTLVELADTPGAIQVPPSLPSLLRRLCDKLQGRLAIVSGRSIADLERHLDCAGIAISGSHGIELRLADGVRIPLAAPFDSAELGGKIERFAAQTKGLLVETKPSSIALHYRKAPAEAERVERFMSALARQTGLSLQPGKMVFELRPKGADKGDAIRAFMAEPEFGGARPVMVGDDATDEDAFEAAAAMGGTGILVGPERPSAAKYRLAVVGAVASWLTTAAF